LRRRGSRASSGRGQFVILRICENGERIPLTIEKSDPEHGTVNIVVQSIGKTTTCSIRSKPGTAFSTSSGRWASLRKLPELRNGGHDRRRRGNGDGLSDGCGHEARRQ
jgi:hypothetical protein